MHDYDCLIYNSMRAIERIKAHGTPHPGGLIVLSDAQYRLLTEINTMLAEVISADIANCNTRYNNATTANP